MQNATPAVQEIVQKLLAMETVESQPTEFRLQAMIGAFERLRLHLSKLVGVSGYEALLARALALARVEVPWLGAVQVKADGTIDGFSETALHQDTESALEGGPGFPEAFEL